MVLFSYFEVGHDRYIFMSCLPLVYALHSPWISASADE